MANHLPTLSPTVPLTVDHAIDIPAALASNDTVLDAAISLARQRMRDLRGNRASLAFLDAKTADTVLSTERMRRHIDAHRAVSEPAPARLHPCNAGCVAGNHPVSECRCACLGANHARADKQLVPSGRRTGFERMPVVIDEEF